jgi:predicted ester cyclase
VAARFTVTGTHQGELMGAKPTGKKITVHGIDMMRIVSGKVVRLKPRITATRWSL